MPPCVGIRHCGKTIAAAVVVTTACTVVVGSAVVVITTATVVVVCGGAVLVISAVVAVATAGVVDVVGSVVACEHPDNTIRRPSPAVAVLFLVMFPTTFRPSGLHTHRIARRRNPTRFEIDKRFEHVVGSSAIAPRRGFNQWLLPPESPVFDPMVLSTASS